MGTVDGGRGATAWSVFCVVQSSLPCQTVENDEEDGSIGLMSFNAYTLLELEDPFQRKTLQKNTLKAHLNAQIAIIWVTLALVLRRHG